MVSAKKSILRRLEFPPKTRLFAHIHNYSSCSILSYGSNYLSAFGRLHIQYRGITSVSSAQSVPESERVETPPFQKIIIPPEISIIKRTKPKAKDLVTEVLNDTKESLVSEHSLPKSMEKIRKVMDKHPECVVLTQMGSFYELYFEHAEKYGPLLELKVAEKNFSKFKIPMAGFPLYKLNKYLEMLVKVHGNNVAIVDQYERDPQTSSGASLLERKVVRIVTPGTLIDEAFRNFQKNNFLLSIYFPKDISKNMADPAMKIGLAWADVSLGVFYVQEVKLENLMTEISRIAPSEIVLEMSLKDGNLTTGDWYAPLIELRRYFIKYISVSKSSRPVRSYYHMFTMDRKKVANEFNELNNNEIDASLNILRYVLETLPEADTYFEAPVRQLSESIMQIDNRTIEALELHKTIREDSKKGSLFSCMKRTVSQSGTRLLIEWLSAPSLNKREIVRRQQLVKLFSKRIECRENLITNLKKVSDLSRLVQRFSLNKGDAVDLWDVADSLKRISVIKDTLIKQASRAKTDHKTLGHLIDTLEIPVEIAHDILDNFDESRIQQLIQKRYKESEVPDENYDSSISRTSADNYLKEITDQGDPDIETEFFIKRDATAALVKYHKAYEIHKERRSDIFDIIKHDLEKQKTRTIRMDVLHKIHKRHGHCIYVSTNKATIEKIKENPNYEVKSSGSAFAWITSSEWNSINNSVDVAFSDIEEEEKMIMRKMRTFVIKASNQIKSVSRAVDYIDVTTSFAVLASEKSLVCPKVDNSLELEIEGGRHISVEEGFATHMMEFVPNDCDVGLNGNLWVISGPNMGGKSTFLRQNAIIVIMAQMGSFVPAKSARIGIVDKIFSRVGSADDLYRDMSTFMVEMVETSFILKRATERSLAVLDEVGRGTSGKEGLAIAYSTLVHLLKVNNCRSLFATHFGRELYELLEGSDETKNEAKYFCTKVLVATDNKDEKAPIVFEHKIQEGISEKSYAIKVAELAGFPREAIDIATRSLKVIENKRYL